jgi:hypothetical protein
MKLCTTITELTVVVFGRPCALGLHVAVDYRVPNRGGVGRTSKARDQVNFVDVDGVDILKRRC